MLKPSLLRNPQLEGTPFLWEAGSTGVLLCHGYTATTAEVRLLARFLHDQGYTVAAPLLPGHGTSPKDCNRYSWKDWYASVELTFQQLAVRCQRVVIGGESLGALLTLQLAANHPEAIVVLCYAPALRLKFTRLQTSFVYLLAPFITSVPKPPPADDNPWQGYGVQPLKSVIQLLRFQKVILPQLPRIHQPLLIVQGRLDPTVSPQSPQIIFDSVSSSIKELHWLEHSTHCVILDKERDLAARLTLDFLKRVVE